MAEKPNTEKVLKDWKIQMWLGQESYNQGKYVVAERKFKKALADLEACFVADERLAITLNNLALCHCAQGRHDLSEPLYQKALSIDETSGGGHSTGLAQDLENIATHYRKQRLYDKAQPLYRKALSLWEQELGAECAEAAGCLSNLGVLLSDTDCPQEAIASFKKALGIKGAILGCRSKEYAETLVNLATTYCRMDKCDEADPLFDEGIRTLEYMVDPAHEELTDVLDSYMTHLKKVGRLEVQDDVELFKKRNRSLQS